jgi:zinc transport system substrate-binding protein
MVPRRLIAAGPGVALALAFGAAAAGEPRVAVSIKPIHSLIAAVMDGVAEPYLLVAGAASPHAYALRPSDAKALSRSTLVFWVGPEMERFLDKPLGALAGKAVRLAGHPRLTAVARRAGDGGADPHLWLDPANARAIAAVAVMELSAIDPGHAALYRANGDRLTRRIDALDRDLRARLEPLSTTPFVVFHDAYRYLERAYGLNAVAFVTTAPERPPGARHLHRLRLKMRQMGVRCLFREPQFEPRLIAVLTARSEVRVGVLDPLGAQMEAGPDLYFRLMRANADALVRCLAGPAAVDSIGPKADVRGDSKGAGR